ncbi:MAG: MFS transporter [Deltaproteobacteria bacterium]|nr:MFS transporter [Deltaproteobacteria bacterium]
MSALASSRRWSALAHRDFRVYWVGQAISLVGTWMQQVAQGWAVSSLTTRNGTLALVSLVASIPMVGLSLAGGAAADRHSRRDILIVTQVLLAAVAFAYGALVWTGHLTMVGVFCLALVTGVVIAYDLPAQSALTPELVPAQDIPSAIALNQSIFHGARLIGPFLAGLVMSATSTAFAFFANGASYFAVVASLLWIRPPVRRLGAAPSTRRDPRRHRLRAASSGAVAAHGLHRARVCLRVPVRGGVPAALRPHRARRRRGGARRVHGRGRPRCPHGCVRAGGDPGRAPRAHPGAHQRGDQRRARGALVRALSRSGGAGRRAAQLRDLDRPWSRGHTDPDHRAERAARPRHEHPGAHVHGADAARGLRRRAGRRSHVTAPRDARRRGALRRHRLAVAGPRGLVAPPRSHRARGRRRGCARLAVLAEEPSS